MKANYTRIAVILDRSGSMQSVCEATVAGFNEFVRTQQSLPGEVKLKLVQFDNFYEVVFDEPLHAVPELTQQTFVPRGSTALLDAQGRTIVELGAELAEQPEEERPSKVIVLTLTDGMENASKTFTRDRVAELVRQQREVYKWEFIYLGANQDAIAVARSMNIPAGQAMTFNASPAAMRGTMQATAKLVWNQISMPAAPQSFSDEDRAAAIAKE